MNRSTSYIPYPGRYLTVIAADFRLFPLSFLQDAFACYALVGIASNQFGSYDEALWLDRDTEHDMHCSRR
jgi:hypothetical protein